MTARRNAIRRNHSATHLLHAALAARARRSRGPARLAGDSAERLRFDISHPKAVEAAELARIEAEVNERVRLNAPVSTRLMPTEQAIEAGAMALFGEKYGDEVRVVTMGGDDPDAVQTGTLFTWNSAVAPMWPKPVILAVFLVVSESAVGAGLRRIEALTGRAAQAYTAERLRTLEQVSQQLRTTPDQVSERITALLDERRKLERDVTDLRRQLATGGSGNAGQAGGCRWRQVCGPPTG